MNEVSGTKMTNQALIGPASSKGNVDNPLSQSGKDLPEVREPVVGKEQPQEAVQKTQASLDVELAEVNDYVQSVQRNLQFSVDDELDQTVIRVVDRDSGEVIRQIPEDVFLELARNLKDDGELQLVDALG